MKNNDNSVALWAVNKDPEQETKVDLHVNFWNFKQKLGQADVAYLETGLMISNWGNIKNITLSLPIKLSQKDVIDLGGKFKDADVATAIFNERISATQDPVEQFMDLKIGETCTRVCFFENMQNLLCISEERTEISILESHISERTRNLNVESKLYVRFRFILKNENIKSFLNNIKPHDRFLLTGYDYIEYFDFRLNRIRNLPDPIRKNVISSNLNLLSINFFIICCLENEIMTGYKNFDKCRMLEESIWHKYFEKDLEVSRLNASRTVVYQWKESNKNDFSAFVKFKRRKSGFETIVSYLIFILAVSILASFLPSLAQAIWSLICQNIRMRF